MVVGEDLKAYNFDMAVEIGTDRIKEALATGAKEDYLSLPLMQDKPQ